MSNNTKHTPGPWEQTFGCNIVTPTGQAVTTVHAMGRTTPEEREANARLIAAAPDMLTALKACLHDAELRGASTYAPYNELYAVIAKAEGK